MTVDTSKDDIWSMPLDEFRHGISESTEDYDRILGEALGRTSDEGQSVGADLVTHVVLLFTKIARDVLGERPSIILPSDTQKASSAVEQDTAIRHALIFRSADFITGSCKVRERNGASIHSASCCKQVYYDFSGTSSPNQTTFKNHGWQLSGLDREFQLNPNEYKAGQITTFAAFPAFFKHDHSNFVHTISAGSSPALLVPNPSCRSNIDLYTLGLNPYLRAKQVELKQRPCATDCILMWLGITSQGTARFDDTKVSDVFALFLTVDLVGFSAFHVQALVEELRKHRYLFKYILLQVLTGDLLRDSKEKQQELKKQALMLALVEQPLRRISVALDAMQEDTQELKAVMYDPSQALFSAAPLIKKYFVDGSWVGGGGIRWKVAHNYETIDSLGVGPDKDDQLRGRPLSIAAIILEVFGELAPWPKDEYDLCARARACISRDDKAFSSLKDQLLWLVGRSDSQLDGLLIPYKPGVSPDTAIGATLERIKKAIYRPFKDGDYERSLLPLALLLRESEPADITYYGSNLSIMSSVHLTNTRLIKGRPFVLPVPRYAHWLSFVHGILSYVRAEKQSAKLQSVIMGETHASSAKFEWEFKLVFSQLIFDKRRDMVLQKMLRKVGSGSESNYHGNFLRPFLEFASKLNGFEISDQNPRIVGESLVIFHKDVAEQSGTWDEYNCTTSLSLADKEFRYTVSYNQGKDTPA